MAEQHEEPPRNLHAELASYDFTVQHLSGKKTSAADGLSWSSHLPPPMQEEINEEEDLIANIMHFTDSKENKATMNWKNIKRAQEKDDLLRLVRRWLIIGKKPVKEDVKGIKLGCLVLLLSPEYTDTG